MNDRADWPGALLGTDDLEALADAPGQRLTVELLPDGRMRAPNPQTRAILRDRLRNAEVLSTGRGWAVLRSLEPPTNEPPPEREVVVTGSLGDSGISVIDFIGFLATGYQTGVLTASSGELERSVYFAKGDVVWAATNAPDERLGEFLVARGKLTRDQLHAVISQTGNTKIGRTCVERGFISAHTLWIMIQAQLQEIFARLLSMNGGLWAFARVKAEVLAESQFQISTQGLLVEALRRLDELQVYRQRVRSAKLRVQRVRPGVDGQVQTGDLVLRLEPSLKEEATQLLRALPGSATILELMRLLGKGEFEVTRIVYHLLRANLLEIVHDVDTGPIPRRTAVSKTEAKEVLDIYSMALREMFEAVSRISRLPQFSAAIGDFLRDESGNGAYAALLRSVQLHADGSLDEEPIYAAVEALSMNAQGLSDALSELLFFALFQATELLGRRKGDDLARRIKMIHGLLTQTRPATP